MALDSFALNYSSRHTQVPVGQCESALKLFLEDECTLPFVARYRKDRTGNLNEIQLRNILHTYKEALALEKRRQFILDAMEKKGVLTEDLKRAILRAVNLLQLEDIYLPFKSKTPTKAEKARALGLTPLAQMLLTSTLRAAEFEKSPEVAQFFGPDKEVKSFREAIHGAQDILIEWFAHEPTIKDKVRIHYWKSGKLVSHKREKAETIKDHLKYKDFFEYSEDLSSLKSPKGGHRFMAMRRGAKQRVLKVEINQDMDLFKKLCQEKFFAASNIGHIDLLNECVERAFVNYLWPSLDQEIKNALKVSADEISINIFSKGLENLLLAPYLGSKAVMGVDPGIVSGHKVVIISEHGKFLGNIVIYTHGPKADQDAAVILINKILDLHPVEHIAIGNGTAGRETLEFFESKIDKVISGQIKVTLVSEAGASVYSASELAQKEFPDLDVTVRGAISIARRFQDPLAELVKIEPKALGIGQYQHDVNQTELDQTLKDVVEHCVNYVGVDLNTASAELLSYVSGIGPKISEQIVSHRDFSGGIKSRDQLLEIPKFSEKTFEQAAGFLRIYQSKNPLDATFVHPEHYTVLGGWVRARGKTIHDLVSSKELIEELAHDQELKAKIGELTLQDIVKSLQAPSQDPRSQFKSVEFDKDLKDLNDLQVGQWYNGVIANITMFGAFVDIGLKSKGLVHISELAPRSVRDPLDTIKVGQEIRVKVLEVDKERERISLSAITDEMRESEKKKQMEERQKKRAEYEAQQKKREEQKSASRESSSRTERPPQRREQKSNQAQDHNKMAKKDHSSRENRPAQSADHPRRDQRGENKARNSGPNGRRPSRDQELKQNPFAVLKNLKLP